MLAYYVLHASIAKHLAFIYLVIWCLFYSYEPFVAFREAISWCSTGGSGGR